MDWLLRLLLRLIVVPLGMVAGFVATMLVVLIGYWRLGDVLANISPDQAAATFDTLAVASYLLMIVSLSMWAVATIGILFAEAFAIRSWIFHVANGAVSAWLATSVFAPYDRAPSDFNGDLYIVAAGLAGGLAYWLVAGWSSGFWKPVGRATSLPPSAATTPPPPAATAGSPPPAGPPAP